MKSAEELMKSSKELMISELPYITQGKELFEERQAAKELLYDYNTLRPSQIKARNKLLKNLLGSTGNRFFIEPPFRCDYGYNIKLGENFYANYNLTILDSAPITIGDNVLIGPNVGIYSASHPLHASPRTEGWEIAKSIIIGNQVWIGAHACILPGVKIGDNTVVGAGSVVTRDLPANVLAVGNPCRVVRTISDAEAAEYRAQEDNDSVGG